MPLTHFAETIWKWSKDKLTLFSKVINHAHGHACFSIPPPTQLLCRALITTRDWWGHALRGTPLPKDLINYTQGVSLWQIIQSRESAMIILHHLSTWEGNSSYFYRQRPCDITRLCRIKIPYKNEIWHGFLYMYNDWLRQIWNPLCNEQLQTRFAELKDIFYIFLVVHCTHFISMDLENMSSLQLCPVHDAVCPIHSYKIPNMLQG